MIEGLSPALMINRDRASSPAGQMATEKPLAEDGLSDREMGGAGLPAGDAAVAIPDGLPLVGIRAMAEEVELILHM